MNNKTLIVAGSLSLFAALAHIAIIFGGPEWYRFFGAGEQMATLAAQGSMQPAVVTALIAGVLAIWGLYGFAGAGLLPRLPLQKFALVAISFIYLLRALSGLFIAGMSLGSIDHAYLDELREQQGFMLVSSFICLVFGLTYAIGTAQVWSRLSKV